MFENDHPLPQEFCTPLRKKQNCDKFEYDQETDYSQGRSSLTKSSSVRSTIASPRLYSSNEESYFDIDLCSVQLQEEESQGKCFYYHEKGYCKKGTECGESHIFSNESQRRSNWNMLTNFPELVMTKSELRVRSFLE